MRRKAGVTVNYASGVKTSQECEMKFTLSLSFGGVRRTLRVGSILSLSFTLCVILSLSLTQGVKGREERKRKNTFLHP
jgi:hypothetical protein